MKPGLMLPVFPILLALFMVVGSHSAQAEVSVGIGIGGDHHRYRSGTVVRYRTVDPGYTTWYPEDGFGGPTSLRLQSIGRFVAPNRAVVSVDLRYKYLDAPMPASPFRVWLLGFVDAGRLWNQGEDPKISNWHWSTGVGARLQLSKSTILGFDIGAADAGFGFGIGTSFAF